MKRSLTGMRPTGKLHVGHYKGSIEQLLEVQKEGKYEQFVFIADTEALSHNAENVGKVKESIEEMMVGFLACGLDPKKTTLFCRSEVPELFELMNYLAGLCTVSRLERNPTIKSEIKEKGLGNSCPVAFLLYPIAQAADILAYDTDIVPVGEDQMPVIELTREICDNYNRLYGNILKKPEGKLVASREARRVKGIDGSAKMSKSMGNCIYLDDDYKTLHSKVFAMYTDPNHIKITDPGDSSDKNMVFYYLRIFGRDQKKVKEMAKQYKQGGLGDVTCKKYLLEEMEAFIAPIRERYNELKKDMSAVKKVYAEGVKKARLAAKTTLDKVKAGIGMNNV